MSARDKLRSTIFENAQPKKEIIDFFGTKIELRQPALDQMEQFQTDPEDEDGKRLRIPRMMIALAYVPGTEERVFEEADAEMLCKIPMSGDVNRFLSTFADMTEMDVEDKVKN